MASNESRAKMQIATDLHFYPFSPCILYTVLIFIAIGVCACFSFFLPIRLLLFLVFALLCIHFSWQRWQTLTFSTSKMSDSDFNTMNSFHSFSGDSVCRNIVIQYEFYIVKSTYFPFQIQSENLNICISLYNIVCKQ